MERVSRGKSYDARARAADKKPGPPPKSGDYKSIEEAALRNYVEAKKKLAQIQSIYQTEYKREFQNWTESTAHIQIAAGFPSDKKNESDGNVNGGANPLSSPKRNAWGTSNTEKREVSLSPIRATSPIKRGSDLESLQNFSLRDRSVSPIKSQARDAIVSPHKVSPGSDVPFGKSPKKIFKDITLFTEAVPDLPAAGVTEEQAHANKQKRHYPEKKAQLQQLWFDMSKEGFVVDDEKQEAPQEEDHAQDSVKKSPTKEKDADLPASFKQAQDLLNRAHKRSQKLEEELKVENADS